MALTEWQAITICLILYFISLATAFTIAKMPPAKMHIRALGIFFMLLLLLGIVIVIRDTWIANFI